MPLSVVFQTPPEPTATYQVARSVGSIAMSAIRPEASDGPMLRSVRPAKVSAVIRSGAPAFAVSARFSALAAGAAKVAPAASPRATIAQPIHTVFDRFLFMPSP